MAIALTESAEPPAQLPGLLPEVSGRSPWALAGRRLWRNRIAMAALVLFLLIIAVSFAAPLYAHDVAQGEPVRQQPERHDHRERPPGAADAAGRRHPAPGRDADRPDLGRQPLLPRRRPAGPRCAGPDALRRPQLAGDRDRLGGHLLRDRHGRRADRRLLRRAHRRDPLPADGRDLGLPGLPARDLHLDRAADRAERPLARPVHIEATSLWLPTIIIAFIYLPYVYRPMRGHVLSVAEKEFVAGRHRAGRVGPAADLLRHPAERRSRS